jgi:hypothetical protein
LKHVSNKSLRPLWGLYFILLSRVGVTVRRSFDWTIGFIDTVYTPLEITGNYSAIADLHTLQFTVTHTRVLSLHWSYPGNGFQHSNYTSLTVTAAPMKSSLHSLIPSLPSLLYHSTVISGDSFNYSSAGIGSSLYSLRSDLTENTVSILLILCTSYTLRTSMRETHIYSTYTQCAGGLSWKIDIRSVDQQISTSSGTRSSIIIFKKIRPLPLSCIIWIHSTLSLRISLYLKHNGIYMQPCHLL